MLRSQIVIWSPQKYGPPDAASNFLGFAMGLLLDHPATIEVPHTLNMRVVAPNSLWRAGEHVCTGAFHQRTGLQKQRLSHESPTAGIVPAARCCSSSAAPSLQKRFLRFVEDLTRIDSANISLQNYSAPVMRPIAASSRIESGSCTRGCLVTGSRPRTELYQHGPRTSQDSRACLYREEPKIGYRNHLAESLSSCPPGLLLRHRNEAAVEGSPGRDWPSARPIEAGPGAWKAAFSLMSCNCLKAGRKRRRCFPVFLTFSRCFLVWIPSLETSKDVRYRNTSYLSSRSVPYRSTVRGAPVSGQRFHHPAEGRGPGRRAACPGCPSSQPRRTSPGLMVEIDWFVDPEP